MWGTEGFSYDSGVDPEECASDHPSTHKTICEAFGVGCAAIPGPLMESRLGNYGMCLSALSLTYYMHIPP